MGATIEENVYRLGQQRAAAMDLSAAAVKRQAGGKERGGLTIRQVTLIVGRACEFPVLSAAAVKRQVSSKGRGGLTIGRLALWLGGPLNSLCSPRLR